MFTKANETKKTDRKEIPVVPFEVVEVDGVKSLSMRIVMDDDKENYYRFRGRISPDKVSTNLSLYLDKALCDEDEKPVEFIVVLTPVFSKPETKKPAKKTPLLSTKK